MGVRGLMSYITNNSHKFMKNHDLHDTYLVIDGNCIMTQLYIENKCNCCFGGDYAEYAFYVSEFFDELLQCKITPIIMIDGAMEDKKLKTILKRSRDRLVAAASSTPTDEKIIFPWFAKYVFRHLARQREIRLVQSTFEVDHHIASIAKILNCPVLSFDSDFFVYDVLYVPYNTLKLGIVRNSNGFVKKCQIFDRSSFYQEFPGRNDKFLLPLASSILGNDFISGSVFNKFLSTLKVSRIIKDQLGRNKLHLKITAVLKFIQKHPSIDSAIACILAELKPEKQPLIINVIEMTINGYINPSAKMLHALDFTQEEIDRLVQQIEYDKVYRFQTPTDSEKLENNDYDEEYLSCNEVEDEDLMCEEISEPETENNLESLVPAWFLAQYNRSMLPSYFLDMINRQHIVTAEQMEDFSHPPVVMISLKIINVIFSLLSSGTTNAICLKFTTRGKNNDLETYDLHCNDYKLTHDIPPLENLNKVPQIERKQILLSTLGVSDESLETFPRAWRLYVGAIKYWTDSSEKMFSTNYHLYSLVLMIVYHAIRKISECQSFFKDTNKIKTPDDVSLDKSLRDSLAEVTDDCFWADRFFKSKMFVNKNEFNITVVHAFALFQNCLRYSIDLNALLGCPLPEINVADFFSGSLIYNLYDELKNYKKLNGHICDIFKKSPSVLQLFISLSKEVQNLLKNK